MMIHQTPNGATTFGYLSTLESPEHGYFGGYLLVGPLGRPLEFHCTAPVRPSRAQQILYGPTLQPYLLGDQIAGALLLKAQLKPHLILTDQPSVLCQRPRTEVPLVLLIPGSGDASTASSGQILVSGHACKLPAGFESDRDVVIMLLTTLAKHVDLSEPFGRIQEAIREAQRIDGRGPDAYAQVA